MPQDNQIVTKRLRVVLACVSSYNSFPVPDLNLLKLVADDDVLDAADDGVEVVVAFAVALVESDLEEGPLV